MKIRPARAALPGQAAPQDAAAADTGTEAAPNPRRSATPARAYQGDKGPGIWLLAAAAGLCMLSGAAATVSFAAQCRLVYAARHLAVAALLEAAIPDVAALVFACLGVALALIGRRAVRARLLNVASAGTSVFMNVIAAVPGWRDLAVWAMPPAAYVLASDTLIGVVRTGAVARHQGAAQAREFTLLAGIAWLALWLVRLAVAPKSTLGGFRAWVIEECPVAPGRLAGPVPSAVPSLSSGGTIRPAPGKPASPAVRGTRAARRTAGPGRTGTKTARFLSLVTSQHGPLSAIPLASVSRISAAIAPQAGLNSGSARAALRRAVLAAQNGEHQ